MSDEERSAFVDFLKDFSFTANGTLPIEKAFVTGGGINTKEVNPKTMESKFTRGLYFSGELLIIMGILVATILLVLLSLVA